MADRFHVNSELEAGLLTLRGPEAHHLSVSRVRVGDVVTLFNGDGREYPARVVEVTRRDAMLEVEAGREVSREPAARVVAACAVPKGDRAQFLVEKLTELGVSEFVPLVTERSVAEGKAEKWERYVIEASKQCGRNVLMRVSAARPWAEVVRDEALPSTRLIAHPGGGSAEAGECAFAVGPEGGFTHAEVRAAVEAGWRMVGLGARILRVETAALTLAARAIAP